jgi:AcrR family transcriptional regulator
MNHTLDTLKSPSDSTVDHPLRHFTPRVTHSASQGILYHEEVSDENRPSLRERTRRAVQDELVDAAQTLFLAKGYDSTTVDDIAASVGLSRRSFFRYFGSKEELVLGKVELSGGDLAAALQSRPVDEDEWTALERMFDGVVAYLTDAEGRRKLDLLEKIVASTPTLRGAYLGRLDAIQGSIVETLRARAERVGHAYEVNDPTPEALVGAAFAALGAARAKAATNSPPLAALLAKGMAGVRQNVPVPIKED